MSDELEAIRARHEDRGRTEKDGSLFDAHCDRGTLLRLLDAAREELAEERANYGDWCNQHALAKDATPSPGAITGIRKAADPCSDCIDGWCQMNCGPRVG
jgi:hypothetical protein